MEEGKLNELRHKYEEITDRLLYFSSNQSEEYKYKFINLFIETWDQLPETDQKLILINLEFIVFKRVEEFINTHDTVGVTNFNRTSQRSFIIINPFQISFKHKTHIYFLAHELAHAYFNHPRTGNSLRCINKENDFVEKEAEPQAIEHVIKSWKILPDPEDRGKLKEFR